MRKNEKKNEKDDKGWVSAAVRDRINQEYQYDDSFGIWLGLFC